MYLPAHFHKQCRDERRRVPDAPFEDGKRYERFPKIVLPAARALSQPIGALLDGRSSERVFSADASIGAKDLSTLLHCALGPRSGASGASAGRHRRYPSGGARHPLEFYLDLRRAEGIERGLYHYHPEEGALYRLLDKAGRAAYPEYLAYEWSRGASAVLILSAVWRRGAVKYFDFAYPNTLIEAGHAAQNVLLCAEALSLAACPLAGFSDEKLSALLDVDGVEDEAPLYVIALGK